MRKECLVDVGNSARRVGRGCAVSRRWWTIPSFVMAALLGACNANEYVTSTAGPMDPNSRTVFTLALLPDSVTGCIMADPSMTRPMTVTVNDDKAVLLTSGGIHYDLTRVSPQVYAGGYWVKIHADLSVVPKRLAISNDDHSCNWMATAP
jgi:hypothetical protein